MTNGELADLLEELAGMAGGHYLAPLPALAARAALGGECASSMPNAHRARPKGV